jgi:hypothetical protein
MASKEYECTQIFSLRVANIPGRVGNAFLGEA